MAKQEYQSIEDIFVEAYSSISEMKRVQTGFEARKQFEGVEWVKNTFGA